LGLPATKVLILASILALSVAYAAAKPQQAAPTPSAKHPSGSTKHSKSHRRSKKRKDSWKQHGQQSMQPDRILAIQQALIREKYLSGEPSGAWDARTQDAMTRYQADHGWQDKVTPDSRALIKLGLGPNYSEKEMLQLQEKPKDAVASNAPSTSSSKQ
jgi:hypothetical protein